MKSITNIISPHTRLSKTAPHCGFQNTGTAFQIPSKAGLQIPRVNVDYRFKSPGVRIPQAKISLISEPDYPTRGKSFVSTCNADKTSKHLQANHIPQLCKVVLIPCSAKHTLSSLVYCCLLVPVEPLVAYF